MRRSFDIVVSLIAALILTPVALITAVAVRVSMGSPVLYLQQRSGKDDTPFTIIKFRTMLPEAFAGQDERERRTRVGDLLRATGLDEIPQLWNILRGDMSVIGPRPTLPEQVEIYTARQRGRLAIRPGLTGWAQVNGRNSIDWPERIELDLWYIENRSLGVDLKILMRTAARILRPEGVYGADGLNPDPPGMSPAHTDPAHRSNPAA
jgi:lipopolysaccharide/colanic/teichoic acid biosynthesis glycosyltransferase